MNLLILTTSYPSGPGDASGVFIHSLARALARRGHSMRVVVPWSGGPLGPHEIDGIAVWPFRYASTDGGHLLTTTPGGIPEAFRRHRGAALGIPRLLSRFAGAASAHGQWADVIHANWLGAGLVGGLVSRRRRVPMVLTLRGDDAYLIRDRRLWRMAGRWVFRRSAAVSVVSANMVEAVERQIPPRLRPVLVPTFGVDVERFHPAERRVGDVPPGRSLQGLFVGNVSRAKGVDVLLRALASASADWGHFRIVGGGPDSDTMRQLARELGLTDRIAWVGARPVSEIPDIMRAADYLVLPSISEGRPNVVIEAMASGLPVIATDVGGTPDLVRDGTTGLLVPASDVARLAAAVERLVGDLNMLRRLGAAARRFVVDENLTWDRTAEEFEAIFRRALAAR